MIHVHRCSQVDDCFHPTRRELELIEMVSQGMTTQRMAIRLGRSLFTVRNNLTRLYQRLNVGDRASLVRRAYELGVLTLGDRA